MAVDMGEDTARAAEKAQNGAKKTIDAAAKIASATGHKEVEAGLKVASKLIKIILPVFLILIILFLYALPTMIFESIVDFVNNFAETVSSWANDVAEAYSETLYSGEYGSTLGSFFPALRSAVSTGASEVFSGVVNWFKSVFTSNEDEEDAEAVTTDELLVAQDEDAEKATLESKIEVTKTKFDSRAQDLADEIASQSGSFESYIKDKVFPNDSETDENGSFLYQRTYTTVTTEGNETTVTTDYYNYYSAIITSVYGDKNGKNGFTMSCTTSTISTNNCISIMALKTVIEGASISDMQLSDYMRWLGYSSGTNWFKNLWGDGDNYTITLDDWGGYVTIEVPKWKGTCLPLYLYEQQKYEEETYGDLSGYDEDYYVKEYGVAALDLITVINIPSPSSVYCTSTTEIEEGEPVKDEEHSNKGVTTTSTDEEGNTTKTTYVTNVYKVQDTITYHFYYTLNYSVGCRNLDSIAEMFGLTTGETEDVEEEETEETPATIDAVTY